MFAEKLKLAISLYLYLALRVRFVCVGRPRVRFQGNADLFRRPVEMVTWRLRESFEDARK